MTLDLYRAEALAWPLIDPAAFSRVLLELDETLLLPGFTKRCQELDLDRHGDNVARTCWRRIAIEDHLVTHAKRLLVTWGSETRLLPDRTEPGRELLRWRRVSMALPPFLLVAAATPPGVRPLHRLRLLQPEIAPARPVAHLHVHAGAALAFETLWTRLVTVLDLPTLAKDEEAPLGGPSIWTRWLIRAALARRTLANRWWGAPALRYRSRAERWAVDAALHHFRCGKLPASNQVTRRNVNEVLLRRIATRSLTHSSAPKTMRDVWAQDPISDAGPWTEGRLLQIGLVPPGGPHSTGDRKLFLQYLRIKTLLYRHLVSDAARTGLGAFTRVYARIDHYRHGDEGLVHPATAEEDHLDLRAVEHRRAPPRTVDRLLDLVTTQQNAPPSAISSRAQVREWGWTFHLIRGKKKLTTRDSSDPGALLWKAYRAYDHNRRVISKALLRYPQLLAVIRAVDIAGDEPEGPLWLAVPALTDLRRLSLTLAAKYGRGVEPLRVTLHVGEDFRHLLTGLRLISEPFDWHLVGPGDRLGHALALGKSVYAWFSANPEVTQPRWERLQDTLWVVEVSQGDGVDVGAGALLRLQQEAMSLAQTIWGRPIDLQTLLGLRRVLGDPQTLPGLGGGRIPSQSRRSGSAALVQELLTAPGVARRAYQPILVPTAPERTLAEGLQALLHRRAARQRIAVELNPSSNFLVDGMKSPLDQPAFHLRPLRPGDDDLVPVTLNADDPLSFSTCLADEFAYTWAGLVVAGKAPVRVAADWLEAAAEASMRFRFTLPISRNLGRLHPPGIAGRRRWWR